MKTKIRLIPVLLMFSCGVVGCADTSTPSGPSVVEPPVGVQPMPIQPLVTAIAPNVGSTGGGGWATITGVDFQRGASVRVGNNTVTARVEDPQTLRLSGMGAHVAGTVDVVVTNRGGLESRLREGYTYAPRESFDVNGEWVGYAGSDLEIDLRFTIRQNVLVHVSCGALGHLVPSLASATGNGEFSFVADGVDLSGTMLSPVTAAGSINVSGCTGARWWADRQQ